MSRAGAVTTWTAAVTRARRQGGSWVPAAGGAAALVVPLVFAACETAALLLTPDFDFMENSISELALTRFGWLQSFAFVLTGVAGHFIAMALRQWPGTGWWSRVTSILIHYCTFASLMTGLIHTDVPGTGTFMGQVHVVFVISLVVLFPFATLFTIPGLWRKGYRAAAVFTAAECLTFAVIGFAMLRPRELWVWYGFYENLPLAATAVWLVMMGILLTREAAKRRRTALSD